MGLIEAASHGVQVGGSISPTLIFAAVFILAVLLASKKVGRK